jgi:hypothetical protein
MWNIKMANKTRLARSVVDVILREAAFNTTPLGRLRDMQSIASVILNRARRQGITPQQVVSAYNQFEGYNKPIPEGADRYRKLAEPKRCATLKVQGQ